jgi:hypothetical protein
MNDSDIEDLLRRHRPLGPPAHLRARVLTPQPPQRIWPWAAAAAALVLSVLTLRLAARQQIDVMTPTLGAVTPADVRDDLTAMFGDDDEGRELVEFLLRAEADHE